MKRFAYKEEPFYGVQNNRAPTQKVLVEDSEGEFVIYKDHLREYISLQERYILLKEYIDSYRDNNSFLKDLLNKKEQEITTLSDRLNRCYLSDRVNNSLE
jgi:uncharacterized membrane protein